jgi:glycosyltransferase involved in cell wall biosynthesis
MAMTAEHRMTKAQRSKDLRPEPLRTLILIPAHNEAENIPPLLDDLLDRHAAEDVLLIDDGSSDGSGDLARARGCKVLRHHFNLGYGASLLTGYHYALIQGYEAVVQMDSDGQHPPSCLPDLLAPIYAGDADHVLGSRFLEGHAEGTTYMRKLASRILTTLARFWTGRRFSDPTSGFQAMRSEVVQALCNDGFPEDFPDLDVLMGLNRRGFRLLEVSTPMRDREHGQSMHGGFHVLYYFYRLGMNIMLLPVRRASLYRKERGKVAT